MLLMAIFRIFLLRYNVIFRLNHFLFLFNVTHPFKVTPPYGTKWRVGHDCECYKSNRYFLPVTLDPITFQFHCDMGWARLQVCVFSNMSGMHSLLLTAACAFTCVCCGGKFSNLAHQPVSENTASFVLMCP